MKEYPIVLAATTGRCGTTYLTNRFSQLVGSDDNWVTHEHLNQKFTNVGINHRCFAEDCLHQMVNGEVEEFLRVCKSKENTGIVFDPGWTMRSLIPLLASRFPSRVRVLHLHRHPIEVAASFRLIGSYSIYNSEQWAITPNHPRARFPEFTERWPGMSPFEKCLYLWLEVNSYALELREVYPGLPMLDVPSKRLFSDHGCLREVAEFSGFDLTNRQLKSEEKVNKNRKLPFNYETRPIKNEWINYQRHPELIELAESMGYDMSEATVAGLIKKYQLPPGMGPWFRNKTGYWRHRKRIGDGLRKLGLR